MVFRSLLIFFTVLVSMPAFAGFSHDIKEYNLDNGLKVLILENHSAPVISYYTFFKVGARNERPGITGISHYFEHMMFNGAKRYGPKMFDQTLERNGGYSNAYTSKDMTVYYEDFSSDILDLVVDMESDRLANLAFEPEVMESERGVIMEERLVTTDNDNTGIIWEELFAAAYMAHPYSWPVIGWMEDIKNYTRQDCLDYHATYYAPNNATVAIVGDVNPDDAIALIRKYYNDIPSGPPPPEVNRDEPLQRGPRRVIIEKPAQHSHIMRGYHVGDKDSPDLFALEIVQFLLTSGESCRLYQSMVNDLQLSLGIWGGFSWGYDPSLFYFYLAVVPGADYQVAEYAFDSLLTEFIENGPTDDELVKAKNSLTANFYKQYKTNNGTAHQIGYYQALYGDWREMYNYVDGIKAVTSDDARKAAAQYFHQSNATTAILIPEGDI